MSVLYVILAIASFLFYFYYYKDPFTPHIIFLSSWLLTCSFSCIDLGTYMRPWCGEMYVVTLISSFSYWLGTLAFLPNVPFQTKIYYTKIVLTPSFKRVLFTTYVICVLCFAVEWYFGGMKTIFTVDYALEVKEQLSEYAIPGIHYGTLLLPYVSLYAIFACFNSSHEERYKYVFIVISIVLISVITKASRGDLLIVLLGYIYIYSRYRKVSLFRVLTISIVIIAVLIGLMFLRVNEGSVVMTTTNNPYVSILYSYIATCYANLNELIMSDYPYHLMGDASFAPLWTISGLRDTVNIVQISQLDVFNATTYLYGFYHDYKLLGIIVFPFILASLISMSYSISLGSSAFWIVLLATLQKALFVPFFGNYFCGEMVNMFPYIYTIFFIVFSMGIRKIKIRRLWQR